MRLTALATLIGTVLAATTAPAMAAWRGYISHPLGFAFAAPGELKVEKSSYRGAVAGARDALVYRFDDDKIRDVRTYFDLMTLLSQLGVQSPLVAP